MLAGDTAMNTLEEQFHEQMLNVYRNAKEKCSYPATRFRQMVSERGGLKAAKDLLHHPGFSDGFIALWEKGHVGLTMEALVLRQPWSELFTEEELAVARKRLEEVGYNPCNT